MKILIVGAGYVGLTSATVFAQQHDVIVVDNDKDKIKKLKEGKNVIAEPDLHLQQKKLSFSTSLSKVMKEHQFDFIFVCVGTPLIGKTGYTDNNEVFDLSMLEHCVEEIIISNVQEQNLNIVIKSTVLPGTAYKIKLKTLELQKKLKAIKKQAYKIEIISNPEFLREGYAVADVRYPIRVVIGLDKKSLQHDSIKKKIEEFYKISDIKHLVFVDNETAELSKLSANAFLANNISFMNEQMLLANHCGAKINDIVKILELDARIGKYINPGIGYGGYCLPKDVVALKSYAKDNGIDVSVLNSTHNTNMKQMKLIINKIENFVLESNKKTRVEIYGIAFKNNTRDSREAPAIYIGEQLIQRGIEVVLVDEKTTLDRYKGSIPTFKNDNKTDNVVALIANKNGYEIFKVHNNVKLIIDPLRNLKKEDRLNIKSANIEYCIIN